MGMTSSLTEEHAVHPKRRRWRAWLVRLCVCSLFAAALACAYVWWNRREPVAPVEIFEGVTYGCKQLDRTDEGHGLMHWFRVDLSAPGIELYVTPLDPSAVAQGWQYRLRYPQDVLRDQNLSVVINGTLFTENSGWVARAGDLARAVETTVADHHVSHVWEHTFLLWFDDALTPRLEVTKPPSDEVLRRARWAIGGQLVGLHDGKISSWADHQPNARTALGIDAAGKCLYGAVFEHASPRRALEELAALGARDATLLDGGHSTTMVIDSAARGVRPGVLMGGWRPLATCFGVRARPVRDAAAGGPRERFADGKVLLEARAQ